MRLINLLPKEEQKEIRLELLTASVKNFWIWIIASLIILFALAFAANVFLKQSAQGIEAEIQSKQELLKSADTRKLEGEVGELNNAIKTIEVLGQNHYYWSNALIELGNIIPTDVTVDLLTLNRASGKVDMAGIAKDRESVLKFWASIYKSKHFHKINFPLANLEKARDDPFTFTFYIKPEVIKQP